uniref:Dolichyl-diphosphooligosaccharide--protein glycosyltransferase subunit 4 n=1 Tax=Salix viminalis TaxID=40686 RepID=A0A6N2LRL2_SALVM
MIEKTRRLAFESCCCWKTERSREKDSSPRDPDREHLLRLAFSLLIGKKTMFDDQDLGFFANFLGIFIFVLVIAYHYVMADPKYEGN